MAGTMAMQSETPDEAYLLAQIPAAPSPFAEMLGKMGEVLQ